ncbi:viral A-type inclusion protein [Reticulomyxa filosa]|uniref:Viral A-type inclusion protein n=1 Tax=Reticulomyxa filosa TaxID=46433 RepID=X6MXK3_RETFI|nr:viral A-type inclusion protein [Reticulomyxa filosa]|eukprot:ETO18346.1 viral A-type inclusion protein [Reticulomyxa filosa]
MHTILYYVLAFVCVRKKEKVALPDVEETKTEQSSQRNTEQFCFRISLRVQWNSISFSNGTEITITFFFFFINQSQHRCVGTSRTDIKRIQSMQLNESQMQEQLKQFCFTKKHEDTIKEKETKITMWEEKINEMDSRHKEKIDELNATWNAKKDERDAMWNAKIDELNVTWNAKIDERDAMWNAKINELNVVWNAKIDEVNLKNQQLTSYFTLVYSIVKTIKDREEMDRKELEKKYQEIEKVNTNETYMCTNNTEIQNQALKTQNQENETEMSKWKQLDQENKTQLSQLKIELTEKVCKQHFDVLFLYLSTHTIHDTLHKLEEIKRNSSMSNDLTLYQHPTVLVVKELILTE